MTDLTYSAIAVVPSLEQAEALAADCENLWPEPTGVGSFEIEDGSGLFEVAVYFVEEPDRAGLALLSTVHGAKDFVISEVPGISPTNDISMTSCWNSACVTCIGSISAGKVPILSTRCLTLSNTLARSSP